MIYITGATGHIGNNLVKELSRGKLDFIILARKTNVSIEDFTDKIIIGDIFLGDFLSQHLKSGDTLIHLAAYINLKNDKSTLTDKINFQGVKTIADFCALNNIFLIYTSSVDCITSNDYLIKEPDIISTDHLDGYYQLSKALATNYLLNLQKENKIKALILYPTAVLGINDFKPSAIGKEIKRTFKRPICVYFHGGYNFVDVKDVTKAIINGYQNNITSSFIISGEYISLYKMYKMIYKQIDKKVLMIKIPVYLIKFASLILPKYKVMIKALLTEHNFTNQKMIDQLKVKPTPINLTLENTITWFKENKENA
jgi:dihydroflavonol-4-reductase